MLNISKFVLRNIAGSLRYGNQLRFLSSKQMLEEPGTVCCSAGRKKEVSASKETQQSKKTIGPYRPLRLECIDNPCCPDPYMPYDEAYKHLLKHRKRTKFQKTWKECPPRRLVQKIVCGEPFPEEKCQREEKKKVSSKGECPKGNPKCVKISMPGCRSPENRKRCRIFPNPGDCEKIKCPYPAFSECRRVLPKPTRPVECGCLRTQGMCEIFKTLKSKGKLKIKRRL